jgi:hypothetical protein
MSVDIGTFVDGAGYVVALGKCTKAMCACDAYKSNPFRKAVCQCMHYDHVHTPTYSDTAPVMRVSMPPRPDKGAPKP